MVGISARAGQVDAPGPKLIVYVHSGTVPTTIIEGAEILASRMFAEAGVCVDWRNGEPTLVTTRHEGAIVVTMADHTPNHYSPGASAEAHPYEGVHLTVFYDRLAWAERRPGSRRHS